MDVALIVGYVLIAILWWVLVPYAMTMVMLRERRNAYAIARSLDDYTPAVVLTGFIWPLAIALGLLIVAVSLVVAPLFVAYGRYIKYLQLKAELDDRRRFDD